MQLILGFYVLFGFGFFYLLYSRIKKVELAFILAFTLVLVGAEYYEIPVHVCGYLGIGNHTYPFLPLNVLHGLLIAIFILLTVILQPSKRYLLLLIPPLIINTYLLLGFEYHVKLHGVPMNLYLAKTIALLTLGFVFIKGGKREWARM